MSVKEVTEIPPFPENSVGLVRGTILRSTRDENEFPIGFDGVHVRTTNYTWVLDELIQEIAAGAWEIVGITDLSVPIRKRFFHCTVEKLKLIE